MHINTRKGLQRSLLAVLTLAVVSVSAEAQATAPGAPTSYFPGCPGLGCTAGGLVNSGVVGGVATATPATFTGSLRAVGTTAYGFSEWSYFPCATRACDGTGGPLSQSEVGGPGYQAASTRFSGLAPGSTGGAFQQYFASATLNSPLGLPTLRASALEVETLGTPPGYSSTCCYYYNSNSAATALQWYTFTGSVAATFTVSYTIDAVLLAYFDSSVDYRSAASVAGGVFISDGSPPPGLELELPLGRSMGGSQMILDGTMATSSTGLVTRTGSVTFTVQPGMGFYMSSYLSANAPPVPGFIVSDGANTMTASFTAGNTSLLTARLPGLASTVVPTVAPEPATYAMLALGLLCIGTAHRQRKARTV